MTKGLIPYETAEVMCDTPPGTALVVPTLPAVYRRQWRDEPDGPNDRPVEIWYNNNWVPAYFSNVKKGDFYLWSGVDLLEPGKCFFAASDCVPQQGNQYKYGFVIVQGSEIVSAPERKEIDVTPDTSPPKLESPEELIRLALEVTLRLEHK